MEIRWGVSVDRQSRDRLRLLVQSAVWPIVPVARLVACFRRVVGDPSNIASVWFGLCVSQSGGCGFDLSLVQTQTAPTSA
jgi:hypothetical protein